jgi:hypothetical protein
MRYLLSLLLAAVVMGPSAATASDPGDAGAVFLRFGMGARASAMGEAFSAVAEDASAMHWNPGAMAAVLGTNAMFVHTEYYQSVRLEQAAIVHETDWGTFGMSFTGLYMDEMDRYDNTPSAVPLGTFSAYDVGFAVGYSRYIIPNLAAGVSGKIVYENIDETTAKGWAFDAGLYHISRIEGVKLAAVVANFGPPIRFENDHFTGSEFDLPQTVRLGASYEREYDGIRGDILATFDVVFTNDGSARQHIGAEYGYDKRLFVRGGFKAGYDSQGATFGAGIRYSRYSVDYAFLLVDNDLGDTHRIGVSVGL